MAFGTPSFLGSGANKTGATSITFVTDEDAPVGDLILVASSWDNSQTADGNTEAGGYTPQITASDESGNTYTRIAEATETDGAADDGSVVAVHYSVATTQLDTADDVTVTNSSSESAKAAAAIRVPIDAASVEISAVTIQQNQDAEPADISIAGLSSAETLFLHVIGQENNTSATTTFDSDYTPLTGTGTSGGGAATNQRISWAYRIVTATGDTATGLDLSSTVGAHVSILIAIREVAGGGTTHNGAASMSLVATITTAALRIATAAASLGLVFNAATTARRTTFATASTSLTFNTATVGTRSTFAASSTSLSFNVATAATRKTFAASSTSLLFNAATVGTRTTFGASSSTYLFNISSQAAGGPVLGSASLSLQVGIATVATRTAMAASSSTYTVGIATAANRTTFASVSLPIVFGITTVGTGPSVTILPAGEPGYIADYGRGRIDRTLVGRIT